MASLMGRMCSSLCRVGCRRLLLGPSANVSSTASILQLSTPKATSNGDIKSVTTELRNLVRNELKFEKAEFEELPEVPGFQCKVNGAVASFEKSADGEEVKVVVDVNSTAEVNLMEGQEQEDDQDMEVASVPAFTVTVKNSAGLSMQLECSYDTVYDDKTDMEEMKLQVDSVSMVSADTKDTETLYTLPATELNDEISACLEKYLSVRGIDSTFGADLLMFFQVFEHNVYIHEFLEKLEQFSTL